MPTCPGCGGTKKTIAAHALMADGSSRFGLELPCFFCDGAGEVSEQRLAQRARGIELRGERLSRQYTLREAAEKLGISAVELSDAQQGWIDPEPYFERIRALPMNAQI